MTPARWTAIRAAAEGALALPPAARAAFLDSACGTDAGLRGSAERLVLACERAARSTAFLAEPASAFAGPILAALSRDVESLDRDGRAELDAAADDASTALEVVRRALADRYTVERELGRGGMATVYLAQDLRHGRQVAVKVLQPELRASVSVDRFLREIRLSARLTHPHILPLHDSGVGTPDAGDDGLLYYVMPFVEGESLRQRLAREQPLPIASVVRLLREVAGALAYAHRHGVIHRDVKPENILLEDGHAVVADFGIARAVSRARESPYAEGAVAALTQAGMSLGTPAYMAPEQALGDVAADHRVDLYALGIVIYESLVGQHPFGRGSPHALLTAHLTETPEPLGERRPDAPPVLAELVMQLLAKDPAARPGTAEEVLRALDSMPALPVAPSGVRTLPAAVPRSRRRRSALIAGVGLLVAAGVGGYRVWRERASASGPLEHATVVRPATVAARPSIAVLPFANTSGDPENEPFSDGLTDELISALGQVAGLKVAGRTSVFALKGRDLSVKAVADTLGVTTVLEGSVRRAGEQLKINVQLVSASDGAVLWSETFDRELRDIFAVQEEIARAIIDALRVRLAGEEGARLAYRPTEDLEAYQLYLRGRHLWTTRTHQGMEQALGYFQHAIERDPKYALAYVGLADAYVNLANYDFIPGGDALPRARAAAAQAVALDPTLAEAYASQGFVLASLRELEAAETALRRAIELQPNYAWAHHFYSLLLAMLGRVDEADAESLRTLELDPLSPSPNAHRGVLLCAKGDYVGARRQLERTLTMAPTFPLALYYLGIVHATERRYDEAIPLLERARERAPGFPGVAAALAYSYRRSGRQAEAEAVLSELRARPERARARVNVALSHAVLGDIDAAFPLLARVEWDVPSLIELRADPLLAELRGDPRYLRLLRAMGLEP